MLIFSVNVLFEGGIEISSVRNCIIFLIGAVRFLRERMNELTVKIIRTLYQKNTWSKISESSILF